MFGEFLARCTIVVLRPPVTPFCVQILKLTLFDITWPNWHIDLPSINIDIEISALDTYICQFAIAVFCAVMFPLVSRKYHQVRLFQHIAIGAKTHFCKLPVFCSIC
jgi:uncharacterized membrane protein YagU involved in acid resistance